MTHDDDEIQVFGFGSFFSGRMKYGDIDILLIHKKITPESCTHVLWCKREILSRYPNADVTILSVPEEHRISFKSKSNSVFVGNVHSGSAEHDLNVVCNKINIRITL